MSRTIHKKASMKKVILSVFLLAFALPGFSQIAKGTSTFGLDLNLYSFTNTQSNSSDKNTNTNFSITPRYGYLITDRLELGLGLGYEYSKTKEENESIPAKYENSQGLFLISPYLRFYQPVSDKFYFDLVVTPDISFGSRKQTNIFGSATNKTESSVFTIGISVDPEFTYIFNNHWGLTFGLGSLGYSSTTITDDDTDVETTTNTFQLTGSFAGSLSLGATYYF
jgi:hypothetical protein